jgi:Mce-associated membrane protein
VIGTGVLPPTGEESGTAVAEGPGWAWRGRRGAGAVLAVGVLLVAANTWLLVLNRSWEGGQDTRAEVVATARQWAVNLITTDPAHATESYERLSQGATGPLAQQLGGQAGTFVSAIQHADVVSTGSVTEAGVSAFDGGSATVLLVARSRVSNGQVPGGEERQYRMSLTLREQGDRWLVSKLDFVP